MAGLEYELDGMDIAARALVARRLGVSVEEGARLLEHEAIAAKPQQEITVMATHADPDPVAVIARLLQRIEDRVSNGIDRPSGCLHALPAAIS